MKCLNCGNEIPVERLEAVPDTKYCVKCTDIYAPKPKAFMVYGHKTAPELIIIDSRNREAIRQADRANNRSR